MPCFDSNGNPIACDLPGAVTGYGLDYEAAVSAARRAPTNGGRSVEDEIAIRSAPTYSNSSGHSTSSSTSQSFADPAVLAETIRANQASEAANAQKSAWEQQTAMATLQANERTAAASAAQRTAELKAKIATDTAQIAQTEKQIAIQQGTLAFTRTKGEFEMQIGHKQEARATQAQVFAQEAQIATLQFSMVEATARRDQAQAQLEQSTGQFNATMGFNVDQANQQAEERRQTRLQGLATDIGTLAADPGDRGKYAATVLANSGWGQQDAALATTDLRTQQSLTPLQALLTQRDQVSAQDQTPFSYTPIATPQIGALNFNGVSMPTPAAAGQFPTQPPAYGGQVTAQPSPDPFTAALAAVPGNNAAAAAGQAAAAAAGAPMEQPSGMNAEQQAVFDAAFGPGGSWNVPQMKDGGLAEGAFIAGEGGGAEFEELVIPLAEGQALVLNKAQQAKMHPEMLSRLKKMAGGGVFSGGTIFGGQAPDTSQASAFLNEASTRARSGTPWAGGQLPTPVYASTPGFDPVVAQLLASISAQATGLDQGSFLRLAALQAPQGMQQQVVRRSR